MIIKEMLAHTSNYTKGRNKPIEYIVVHYTANNGDRAEGNGNYFAHPNRNASAHYFVDENTIVQSVHDEMTRASLFTFVRSSSMVIISPRSTFSSGLYFS